MVAYSEKLLGNLRLRKFAADVVDSELKWHQDEKDRKVKILQGEGWQLQFDDQLPQTLHVGDVVHIPRGVWHRVLRGSNTLSIAILESGFIT